MIDPLWLLLIGMLVVVGGIMTARLHPFLALTLGALIVGSLTTKAALENYAKSKNLSQQESRALLQDSVGERVAGQFGRTCARIGILIAMASIIGKCLLQSGSAERIVRTAVRLVGESRAPVAFVGSSFLLAMPVFFDTVFYLMIPLGKALGIRDGRNYGLYVLAIVAGGTIAHSLVPPTPGPLFVASELSVSIGAMILGGTIVGLIASTSGYVYACWANRKWPIPLRDSADVSVTELEALSKREERDLPPFWLAVSPIALPVILIAGNTILDAMFAMPAAHVSSSWEQGLAALFDYLGNPNLALTISAVIALATLAWYKRGDKSAIAASVQHALSSGGLIILITAAGGAFGGILQQTGIGFRIEGLAADYHLAMLPLAFGITALVRTAQGSATVAMITAIGILGGMTGDGQLGFHPLYLALAIGCGSKPFPWMNDSGFWVICKMSGMTEAETLKTSSIMISLMGFVGLLATMILARLFPLV